MNAVTPTTYDREMAVQERNKSLVIRFERIRRAKVRYGQARLTVARFGWLASGELGDAIQVFERGSIDAERLCWVFVRDRVISHTPSFDWEGAELSLLLDRVTGVSTDPQFNSSDAGFVADALVDAAEDERESAAQMGGVAQKWAKGIAGQVKFDSVALPGALASKLTSPISGFLGAFREGAMTGKFTPISTMGDIDVPSVDWGAASKELLSANVLGRKVGAAGALASCMEDIRGQLGISSLAKRMVDPSVLGIRGVLDGLDWAEIAQSRQPHNWESIYGSEIRAVVSFMLETGINLAWAPRPEIIRQLLSAQTEDERNAILVQNRDQILDDVEAAITFVDQPQFQDCVEACREIVGSCRSGFPGSAQALAGTALSDLVHRYLKQENFRRIRSAFEAIDPMQEAARRLGFYAVGRLWARAFGPFSGRGDTGYNRAESAHILGEHFHEAQLLQALLLLAGLLCEFQLIEDEREGEGYEFAIALLEPMRS